MVLMNSRETPVHDESADPVLNSAPNSCHRDRAQWPDPAKPWSSVLRRAWRPDRLATRGYSPAHPRRYHLARTVKRPRPRRIL